MLIFLFVSFFFFGFVEVLERAERGTTDQDSGIVRGPAATAQQHGQLRLERKPPEVGAGRPHPPQGLHHFDLQPLLDVDVTFFFSNFSPSDGC